MTDEELREFYESNKNAWIMTYKFGEAWSEIELKDFIRLIAVNLSDQIYVRIQRLEEHLLRQIDENRKVSRKLDDMLKIDGEEG